MESKQNLASLQYVPALTGIRALAALLVLGLHAEQNIPAGLGSIAPFFLRGHLGVDCFFLLSGFIITHVYFKALSSPSSRKIKIFLWHRLIRLYPVHVTILAGLVGFVGVARAAGISLNHPEDWSASDIPWQLMLLHAWGLGGGISWNAPSWSISAEWFAYLLFPLLAIALAWLQDWRLALCGAAVVLTAMAWLFSATGWDLNAWSGPPALARVSGEFLCGAALCRAVALFHRPACFCVDLIGITAFAAFLIGASIRWSDFALVLLLVLTILSAAISTGAVAKLLGNQLMVWLGEASYSIYMVHFPVLIVARRVWDAVGFAAWELPGKSLALLVTIAAIVGLAAALFYIVERPVRSRFRDLMGKMSAV